jgi:predicted permease
LIGYPREQADNLYRELHERFSALPGVLSASYSQAALLSGGWSSTSFKHQVPGAAGKTEVGADYMPIGPQFFTTMKIPFVAGRQFEGNDFQRARTNDEARQAWFAAKEGHKPAFPTTPTPAIINQEFANKYFGSANPIGRTFGDANGSDPDDPRPDPGYVVVGVVGDAKYSDLRRSIEPTMYVPLTGTMATFELRTAGDPKLMVPGVRKVVAERESNLPINDVLTESEQIDALLQQERVIAKLSSLFGSLALLLACVGLYGLLSYEVSRRTREIGIRMALGARPLDVVRNVVRQGMLLAGIGCAVGLAAAFGVGRLLAKMLYGVKPGDPATLLSVSVLLLGVALVAAFVPARRATRVDPMVALRID